MKESYLKIEQDDSKKEYPEHYELKSIRAITSVSNSRGNPELQLLSVYRDYGVIPKKERNDNHNRESDDLSTYKIVKPGQLVINKMKAWQGSLGVSDYHGIVSPAYIVCDLDQNLNKKFVHLLLRSHPFVSELNRVSYGVRVNQWDLRYDEFKRISIRLPKRSEQDAIVDFLSKKIAEINRFVEIKEKLISLLAELKVRILNELVTSGTFSKMNTMISEKEYGTIVTTNWKKIRLKFLTEFIVDCLHSTPVYSEDGEYPAIRTADIEPGAIRENGIKKVDHAQFIERTQRAEPKENDILYSREGERYGIAALVPSGMKLCISQRMMHFRANNKILPDYLMWQLNCEHVRAQASADIVGATSPHVNVKSIKNFWLFVPPMEKQIEISSKIYQHSKDIDKLITKLNDQIALLREFRTALIADAVTGKIDVTKDSQ